MRQDILGRVPKIGDTIIRALYSRDNSLHACKITGFTKAGHPKIEAYWRNGNGGFAKSSYGSNGNVPGDFLILDDVQL